MDNASTMDEWFVTIVFTGLDGSSFGRVCVGSSLSRLSVGALSARVSD